ncbi:unnamed protein product [Ceratitis capitata]|uniref:(Mediterranean fruit fly) hypothetical protein n=1 Tax=Ceratitis capitata TaxID=7213 RepID=A0A811VCF6_CERCA|nr:unnamed protein product [Ceratitis capitata]
MKHAIKQSRTEFTSASTYANSLAEFAFRTAVSCAVVLPTLGSIKHYDAAEAAAHRLTVT